MKQIRKRLTYANVMSSLAVFLILGGATAFAASRIGPNQLKANSVKTGKIVKEAVTAGKIKKNAVTNSKIAASSVTGEKVADGSITGTDINLGATPFSRIIAKFRGNSSIDVPNTFVVYPMDGASTYTQAPEEIDSYYGALDITFQSTCTAPRSAVAYVLVDSGKPTEPQIEDIAALGEVQDTSGGTVTKRLDAGSYLGDRFEPGVSKGRTVTLIVTRSCSAGSGVTATFGGVDVVGTK